MEGWIIFWLEPSSSVKLTTAVSYMLEHKLSNWNLNTSFSMQLSGFVFGLPNSTSFMQIVVKFHILSFLYSKKVQGTSIYVHFDLLNCFWVPLSLVLTTAPFWKIETCTVQAAYKAVQIQGMSAYSERSPGPDSSVCIGIGIREHRLYGFSG